MVGIGGDQKIVRAPDQISPTWQLYSRTRVTDYSSEWQ